MEYVGIDVAKTFKTNLNIGELRGRVTVLQRESSMAKRDRFNTEEIL